MTRAYMPMYWGDYLADTLHLTQAEHGAYLLLIAHYWQHGGLPDEPEKIRIISKSSPKQWPHIRKAVAPLFAEGWKHCRIEKEFEKLKVLSEKRAMAGRKGGLMSRGCDNNGRFVMKHASGRANAGQTGGNHTSRNITSSFAAAPQPPPTDASADAAARAWVLAEGVRIVMAEHGCADLAARLAIKRWAAEAGHDYARIKELIIDGRDRAIGTRMDGWITGRLKAREVA